MADAAELSQGDVVLEIGPGTGVLTRELLLRGATVIAVEADARAIEMLKVSFSAELASGKLQLIHGDIRKLDLHALGLRPRAYKLIANIPYYLSGLLFRLFLESEIFPSDLVFLVQREVAERIARDKKSSLLSLSVRIFGEPCYITTVAPGNFTPPPKVDSSILAVRNISHDAFKDMDQKYFFTVLHTGFASKRKQLLGNLTKLASRDVLQAIFLALQIPLTARGEDLSLQTWVPLVHALFFHTEYTD